MVSATTLNTNCELCHDFLAQHIIGDSALCIHCYYKEQLFQKEAAMQFMKADYESQIAMITTIGELNKVYCQTCHDKIGEVNAETIEDICKGLTPESQKLVRSVYKTHLKDKKK